MLATWTLKHMVNNKIGMMKVIIILIISHIMLQKYLWKWINNFVIFQCDNLFQDSIFQNKCLGTQQSSIT
jgi:hypothetical protein